MRTSRQEQTASINADEYKQQQDQTRISPLLHLPNHVICVYPYLSRSLAILSPRRQENRNQTVAALRKNRRWMLLPDLCISIALPSCGKDAAPEGVGQKV